MASTVLETNLNLLKQYKPDFDFQKNNLIDPSPGPLSPVASYSVQDHS